MAITLRNVTDADLPIFFDLERDPTYNHMAAFTHKDPDDRAAFDAHWKKILANPENKNQTIVFEGQVAGHIASFPMGEDREITYGIARHLWGRGLATEALRAFLALDTVRPLKARAAKDNVGSLRVLAKCGFEVIGKEIGFANARDEEIEDVVLRLSRSGMPPDQDEINRWSGSAPYWEKHREIIRQMFAPVTQALAEDAQISGRQTVLDIATGPGEPALSVAALVGPGGKVVGIDLIPEMVAAARREASRLGLENVRFDVASGDKLPFAPDTFDAALNRFGVMFFPSPMDAVREMLRVLKPGRKLALAVWHFADRNPFHSSLSRVVDRFIDPPPVAPDAPDAFRFATRGKLLEICGQAGVVAPVERMLQFRIDAPIPAEAFWALRLEMSEKLREKIARLPTDQMAEVHRLAVESLSEYSTDHGLSFPAEVLIVSGTKRRSGLT